MLTHKGCAFGLTRFACQQPFKNEFRDTEDQHRGLGLLPKPGQRRPVADENGVSLN